MNKTITIIGAGMAGCFMALCLAKRGFNIKVYESRPDIRKHPYDSGRSFNITLYYRGLEAMKKMEIWDTIKNIAILAEGNVPHYNGRKTSFDPFDKTGKEVLYTVHRNLLSGALITEIEKLPNVEIHFETRFINIDKKTKKITFKKGEKEFNENVDIAIGADGVNSLVRENMQKDQQAELTKDYEDWGYKEVHIPVQLSEELQLRKNATHTWPRKNSLLLAFPNPDDSFTLMFNLPLEGDESFATLTNEESIKQYVNKYFPDLNPIISQISNAIINKPTGNFVTILTKPWYYRDFMVLIGDAAHGVIPFYGQGVSAAFEDSLLLTEIIYDHKNNLEEGFKKYQDARKKNTDVIALLSKENFFELRDKSRSPYYVLKNKTNTFLNLLFPKLWLPPLYYLVAHDTLEYSKAYTMHKRQENIAKWSGFNLLIYLGVIPFILFQKIMPRQKFK
jgi:kynurenine 3-monooxygenase